MVDVEFNGINPENISLHETHRRVCSGILYGMEPATRGETRIRRIIGNRPRSACKSKEQWPRIQTQPRPVMFLCL